MAEKTSAGLCAHAKALQGSPYMWGTYGKRITNDLIDQKVKQYSSQYRSAYIKKLRGYVGTGKRAVDCCGLVKAYMMQSAPDKDPIYKKAYDKNVNGMKSACPTKGKIATLPEVAGLLLFQGTAHMGIYLGDGKVIEAVGSDVVRITELRRGKWDTWGQLSWIKYPAAATPANVTTAIINPGDTVRIKPSAVRYYPGGAAVPDWVFGRKYTAGSKRTRGGVPCLLLKEINSSCAISNLEKVQE